ncbi:hypothetical protein SAMN05216188_117123 [Lentzea xinjiangensis]|uniref:TIR domain-containing protein n=1 Tax=Lentzea xinjiangensis TaxID=402600 RepID=A0A1H9T4P9_9PSEU|nr:hypothetical protein SAMN05216188_117123 [Lentzea xinjiangensis]
MSGYKYDFFISYCRYGSVQRWLLNHFLDKLRECLADQYAPTPKVYVDRSMERACTGRRTCGTRCGTARS